MSWPQRPRQLGCVPLTCSLPHSEPDFFLCQLRLRGTPLPFWIPGRSLLTARRGNSNGRQPRFLGMEISPRSFPGARLPQPMPCRETSCAWSMEALPQSQPSLYLQVSKGVLRPSEEAAGAQRDFWPWLWHLGNESTFLTQDPHSELLFPCPVAWHCSPVAGTITYHSYMGSHVLLR